MTAKKANGLVSEFNGYNKEDSDFVQMLDSLYRHGLSLIDGRIDYNNDMTNKHYSYRVVEDKWDSEMNWSEGKTVGYLSAYKCFNRGLDNPYEILAYIS